MNKKRASGMPRQVWAAKFRVLFLIVTFLFISPYPSKGVEEKCRVLYINSWVNDSQFSEELTAGFRFSFEKVYSADSISPVELANNDSNRENEIQLLRQKLAEEHFDLIVCAGNPAMDLFLSNQILLPDDSLLYFFAYEGVFEQNSVPLPRTAGLTMPDSILGCVDLGLRLFPATESIAIVTSGDERGRRINERLRARLATNGGIRYELLNGAELSTNELFERISVLSGNSFIILDRWKSLSPELRVPEAVLFKNIYETINSKVLNSSGVSFAAAGLGGYLSSAESHGREAGTFAAEFARRRGAEQTAQIRAGSPELTFDYQKLKKSQIKLGQLPEQSILVNAPETLLRRYAETIFYASGILITILLCWLLFLLVNIRRKRHEQEIFKALPVCIFVVDGDGKIIFYHCHCPKKPEGTWRRIQDMPGNMHEQFLPGIRQVLADGQPLAAEKTIWGRRYRVEFRKLASGALFASDCVLFVATDIEDFRAEQESKLALSDRFRMLLESMTDGMVATDLHGVITSVNPIGALLLRRSSEELTGRRLLDVFPVTDENGMATVVPTQRILLGEGGAFSGNNLYLPGTGELRRRISYGASAVRTPAGLLEGTVLIFRDITEEMRKEEELRKTNVMFQAILDNLPCHLSVKDYNDNGRYVISNHLRNKAFGYDDPEVVGHTDQELFSAERAAESLKYDQETLLLNAGVDYIETISLPTGKTQTLRTRKVPVLSDHGRRLVLGISIDVTELIESRNSLLDANTLLKEIFDNLPAMIAIKDPAAEFRYIKWNRSAAAITGMSAEEVIGHNDEELPLYQEYAERFRKEDCETLKEGSFKKTEVLCSMTGERKVICTQERRVRSSNDRTLLLIMGTDLSEEKRLEDQLHNLLESSRMFADRERRLNECLEAALRQQGEDDRIIESVLATICKQLAAHRCCLFRIDEQAHEVILEVESGAKAAEGGMKRYPYQTNEPWFRCLIEDRLHICEDTGKCSTGGAHCSYLRTESVLSCLCIGVFLGDQLWGFAEFDFADAAHPFTDSELHFARATGHIFEIVLARRNSSRQLARSEFEKRLIMDSIRIPILLFHPDLSLAQVNNAAKKLSGLTDEVLYSQPCYRSFCGYATRPDDCPVLRAQQDFQTHYKEVTLAGRDYLLTAYPVLNKNNELMYIIKTLTDVTESNLAHRQLTRALLDAQNASKAKSYFLATMSHELRTPLNAVIGLSELLQGNGVDAQKNLEYLHDINIAGKALLHLVNDVLDLAKLESEESTLSELPTDIARLVRELYSIFKYKADEKKLDLNLILPEELPFVVLDSLRLKQILLNLLGNALKFTDHGSVTLKIELEPTSTQRATLRLIVADTGCGIHPEYLEQIFQPFVQQEHHQENPQHRGTGLGLAITKRLVVRMGGGITLESVWEKGSTFVVTLPNRIYSSVNIAAGNQTPELPETSDEMLKKVLIVDDVPVNLKVLDAMLRRNGIDPVVCHRGAEVLSYLRTCDRLPDLILTDLWMPEMDGAELTRAIRQNPGYASIKIIAVTADSGAEANFDFTIFDGALFKPVTMEKLRQTLEQA